MKNFWVRAASAAVYVALFLGCIYSGALLNNPTLGAIIFGAFLMFVACGCTFEFFRIVALQGATPCKPLGYAYTVLTLVSLIGLQSLPGLNGLKLLGIAIIVLPMHYG